MQANSSPVEGKEPEALKVLLDSSAMLLATFSKDAVLSSILDLASNVLAADAYAVWLSTDDPTDWRAIASRGLSPSYRQRVTAASDYVPGPLQATEDVNDNPLLAPFQEVYAREGIRSLLVVPLLIQLSKHGTLTFYWRSVHRFSESDKIYGTALGNLASAALNASYLHEQNQRESNRLSFLSEASEVLASSLDYETTLQQVARLAVQHIADWCAVHIIENGTPTRLVVTHSNPAMLRLAEEFAQKYPEEIREDRGLGWVITNNQSEVYLQITDEMLVAAARDAEHLTALRALGITSSILVPLASRDRVFGAIRLVAAGRTFTSDDVRLAEDLGRRAATAIDNALLQQAILNQEKMAATGRMAATIAHEVNNPLEALLNLVYLARLNADDSVQVRTLLSTAESELLRIAHIARQTLGFYREHALPVSISVSELISEACRVYEPKCTEVGIAIARELASANRIFGRKGELMQVITNLVSNAIYAMPSGGILSLSVRDVVGDTPGVLIEIRDSGVGIAEKALPKVFEPFFSTRGTIGTGIGLSIAKQIVESHGGTITLESSTDSASHGTKVAVWLPEVGKRASDLEEHSASIVVPRLV